MSSAGFGDTKRLRIATFLAPNVYPVYDFIAAYIGQKLSLPTEVLHVAAHSQYFDILPDVSFICGLPYVQFSRQNPCPVDLIAAPVLIGERYQDRPIYFSDVIVRFDSPLKRFEDFKGHSWAYNELVSQSGYGITRHTLLQMKATKGFFGKVINARSHQNSIRLVASGSIDGAAIDSQVLAVELRDHPELKQQIRIIDALGPSTIQPVVIDRKAPEALKSAIREIFVNLGDDPAAKNVLASGFVERFVSISDRDYDDIRAMLQQAEKANFLVFH